MKKPTTVRTLAAGIVLAACVGGAALAAAPAFAGDSGPASVSLREITKTDPNGAPLAGAVLEVCSATVTEGTPFVTRVDTGKSLPDTEADYRAFAARDGREAAIAKAQSNLDRENALIAEKTPAVEALRAAVLSDTDRATAQAAVDAYAAAKTEQARLDAVATDATAAWQVVAQQMLALQNEGSPVPAELAAQEATLQAQAQAASQAATDYRNAHTDAYDAALDAQRRLDADADAKGKLTAAEQDLALHTSTRDALVAKLAALNADPSETAFAKVWLDRADRVHGQISRNEAAGLSTGVEKRGDQDCYVGISGSDGKIVLPTSGGEPTYREIAAPAGFTAIDGAFSEDDVLQRTGSAESNLSAGGGLTFYSLVNERNPETPPVTPTPTPPAPEVPTPTPSAPTPTPTASATPTPTPTASATPSGTLAYTGGSATPAIWAGVIGGVAALAGGALLWARRKRA